MASCHEMERTAGRVLYDFWQKALPGIEPGITPIDTALTMYVGRAWRRQAGSRFSDFVSQEMTYLDQRLLMIAALGFPTFTLTHSLTAALLLTDVRGVPPADCHLPFQAGTIVLPNPSPIIASNLSGKPLPISQIGWLEVSTPVVNSVADVTGEMQDLGRTMEESRDLAVLRARIDDLRRRHDYPTKSWVMWLSPADEAQDISVHMVWRAPVHTGLTLDRWIEELTGMDHTGPEHGLGGFSCAPGDMPALRAAARILVNTCLYISAHGPGEPTGRMKPKRGESTPPPSRSYLLGREIKLPQELVKSAFSFVNRTGNRAPWKLARRFVVRGHWRNQACGMQRKEHKRMWISPHWKGPASAGEAMERRYAVELTGSKEAGK